MSRLPYWTPQEVTELLNILRNLAAEGHSIIFISHKLNEVMACTSRVVVMLDGRVVKSVPTADTTARDLARLMVGREVIFRLERQAVQQGAPVLRVSDLSVLDQRGLPALRGISFDVSGEILGSPGSRATVRQNSKWHSVG